MDDNSTRLSVYLPVSLKDELEEMAKEVGLRQNQLVVLALHSLVKNYEREERLFYLRGLIRSD
jgi:metal-responsive CopG/Arc/MetJ family transcriptional regulator